MDFLANLKKIYIIIISSIILVMFYNIERRMDSFEHRLELATGTVSLQMYEAIEHYSDSFNIPKHIAYNIAYLETRYKGPFDFDYNPYLTSSAGAKGPMQIIPRYAHYFAGRKVSDKELNTNIKLNVKISMAMLQKWYSIHHDWSKVCGAYNSGRPILNDYAIYAESNKQYKQKWDKID